jgi:GNAT superfamily N-acetyltransferase
LPQASAAIETVVTYLELTALPERRFACPPRRGGLRVQRACRPTVSFYRYLYGTVGTTWTWTERRLLSDAELEVVIRHPKVEVDVLWQDGVPAGYAELDRRRPPDVELAYFGLIPDFIGAGLGRYLLDWAIQRAFRQQTRRFWVHTCDLDHPGALPLYEAAGFRIYDRRVEAVTLLADASGARRQA